MSSNVLKKINDKTEILVIGAKGTSQEISFKLSQMSLESVTQVENLNAILDADLTFQSQINSIVKTGLNHFRNVRNF